MRPLSNPFRLFDISALLGIGTDKPFRLLYLPREIRDMIYHAALCDWGVQGPIRHGLTDDRKDIQLQVMTNKVETNILLTSKQVYEEAKQVFLKGNQFVQIRMRAKDPSLIAGAFVFTQIAIVALGRENVSRFKDLVVMKHTIDFPGEEATLQMSRPEFEVDIIIMKRDLWAFADRMALVDTYTRRSSGHSKHEITIFNPFMKTPSPKFLNVTNLGNLLAPYLENFEEFGDVKVQGEIDPKLAKSVVATITGERPLPSPPDEIVDEIIAWKSLGDESAREHDYTEALQYWNAAQLTYKSMLIRKAWPRLMETAGKEFRDHLSEVAFQLESDRARAYFDMLKSGPRSGSLSDTPVGWITEVSSTCNDALDIGETLGTGWTPSDSQTADIFYCCAKAHRVDDCDVHFAEAAIRHANYLRPDDEEIVSEMEKIVEWKHSMGLP